MKRGIAVFAAGPVGSTPSVPAAVADTGRTHWGSAGKTNSSLGNDSVTGLRAGGPVCLDRLVVAGGDNHQVGSVSVAPADPSDRVPFGGGQTPFWPNQSLGPGTPYRPRTFSLGCASIRRCRT